MPRKSALKCYFGCPWEGPLHKFPKPGCENEERFLQWKKILHVTEQDKGDMHIFNNLRLCSNHFDNFYCSTKSKLLTRNAVPTINLVHYQSEGEFAISAIVQPSTSFNYPNTEVDLSKDVSEYTTVQSKINMQTKTVLNVPTPVDLSKDVSEHTTVQSKINMQPKTVLNVPTPVDLSKDVSEHTTVQSKINMQPKTVLNVPTPGSRKRLHPFPSTGDNTVEYLKKKITSLSKSVTSQKKQIVLAKKIASTKSFLQHIDKYPNTIKLFMKMQTMYKTRARGRRFSKEEKILALTIFKQGPKVYNLLRKLFVLPSKRCLQNLLGNLNFEPGLNDHIFEKIKKVVTKMPHEKRLVNLLFDEVALSPGVEYNVATDEIIGFEDLGNGLGRVKKLADHALVFMIKGIKGKTKQPVCFTFCKSATKKNDLKYLIVEIIKKLHSIGLKVISTICDQAATNVSVIKSLQDDTRAKYLKDGNEYYSKAFEIDGIKVYPLFDTPHLLKGVRNNLLIKTAKFEQNQETKYAKWNHLEQLLNIDEGEDEIRLVNKLTENHVVKDKISKMKVKLAAQVFSQRVSAAMRFLAKRHILPAECIETADFLLLFDKLFDSFNGHTYRDDSKIYKSCLKSNSPHFKLWSEVLPILESIKFESIQKKDGIELIKHESIPSIKNWIHNIKCFMELWDDLNRNNNVSNLITRNFNQDPLENFFSSIRSNGVRNNNPNCNQFISAYKTLIINNFNSPHSPSANCENDDNNCMQSLKSFIFDYTNDSEPNYACQVDSLFEIISEIRNSNSLLHVESKKYVTGYIIKKCKSKIFKNCKVCNDYFIQSEIQVDSFNYEIDYTKKSLFHPSQELIDLTNDIYFVIVACLRKFPHEKHLKRKINLYIDCACDFSLISCENHKVDLIDLIKKITMKMLIHSWCNGVNRILNGKFVKFDDKDEIKKEAFEYSTKRKRNNK